MTEKNPILSVDFKKEYDNLSDGVRQSNRVCVDMGSIQSGLIKEIGVSKFGLLLAIVSFMNDEGKAFPSQRKLGELTGQSTNTINKLINELLETEIDGQSLLKRELVGNGRRKKSIYYISGGAVTNTDAVDETAKEAHQAKKMNARDFAHFYADAYKETYGEGYVINYQRELAMIKNKLIPNYDEETLKAVIEISIKQYTTRWANANYPLPTISMLCSWIANQAYAIYKQDKDQTSHFEEVLQKAQAQDDTDKALDLFNV
ncbi:helix-turn-helix domain-containing protein [Bacillus sp. NPDC077027]|uniref:helix-turn-helix domain-containing protein n=1 Tax=Bacillus sp. NPDC077027 TaxID=3390548 RepID=UPI003CFD2832